MELLRGIGFVSDEGGLRGTCSHRPLNPTAPGALTRGCSLSQSSCWHPHGGRSTANSNHQCDGNAESVFSCPCRSFLLFIRFIALTRVAIITHRPWSAWYTYYSGILFNYSLHPCGRFPRRAPHEWSGHSRRHHSRCQKNSCEVINWVSIYLCHGSYCWHQ